LFGPLYSLLFEQTPKAQKQKKTNEYKNLRTCLSWELYTASMHHKLLDATDVGKRAREHLNALARLLMFDTNLESKEVSE